MKITHYLIIMVSGQFITLNIVIHFIEFPAAQK